MITHINERMADHEARIENLEKADEQRRDGIQRIKDKVDGNTRWLMGVMASTILTLVSIVVALLSHLPIKP